jgi:hypothetical protein
MKYTIRQINFPTNGSKSAQKLTTIELDSHADAIIYARWIRAKEYSKYNNVELFDDEMCEIHVPDTSMRTLYTSMITLFISIATSALSVILIATSALLIIGLIEWVNL